MKSKKGQALIEAAASLAAASGLLTSILILVYFFYVKTISYHYMHQGLLCLEVYKREASVCEKTANKKLKKLIYFKKRFQLNLNQSSNQNTANLQFTAFNQNFSWEFKIKKSK